MWWNFVMYTNGWAPKQNFSSIPVLEIYETVSLINSYNTRLIFFAFLQSSSSSTKKKMSETYFFLIEFSII